MLTPWDGIYSQDLRGEFRGYSMAQSVHTQSDSRQQHKRDFISRPQVTRLRVKLYIVDQPEGVYMNLFPATIKT